MPDLVLARKISNYFRPREDFGVKEIIKYLDENLRIAAINKDVKQNQNEISVAFIVRADEKIGCGHLIRCRTLSKKLQEMRKCEVKFFPKIDLNKISHFEMVITDLPDIKEEQLNQIRKRAKLLVSIDDGHKIKFSSDILINPNINPKIKHNFSKKTKYFSGKNYLILREEFEKFGKKKKMISEKPKQIFVCFGGSDPNNLSEKTARILMGMKLDKKIRIRIIAGRGEKIKRVISSRRNFILQKNVSNLAEVLWQSDLAIISGGTLMYEACVLGVPSIIICQNQEQFEEADFFSKKEAVINLGVFNKLRSEKLKNKVVKLLESQNLRKRLSANAKRLISFQGAERIAKILLRELNKN